MIVLETLGPSLSHYALEIAIKPCAFWESYLERMTLGWP
jgi:hypothetical protein